MHDTAAPPLAHDERPGHIVAGLTGLQIRAARAILRLSAADLAKRCGLSYAAVQRAEAVDDMPNMQSRNLAAIKATLEESGVVFLEAGETKNGGRGVRMKAP